MTICLYFNEPCLLVGETGCGKTTLAQHLAEIFHKKLYIYNMSQNSDAVDLVGGYKPIEAQFYIKQILTEYVRMFGKVANLESNHKFLNSLQLLFRKAKF